MRTIIIPTYNEAKNIPEVLERIHATMDECYEVLVVDDNSPDGTARIVEQEAENNNYNARAVVRYENPGLSAAVIRGLKEAKGDTITVIDGDLQHPPEKIPKMVEEVENGYDLVVGSRKMENGGIEGWCLSRKLISKTGSLFARFFSSDTDSLTDPMSGYFTMRNGLVDPQQLDAHGFKILLEILHTSQTEKITEVPYTFRGRRNGESNLGLREYIDFGEQLLKMKMENYGFSNVQRKIQMLEFGAIGASGVVVNTAIFLLAIHFGAHYLLAGFLAFLGAVQWNFLWNWLITFDKPDGSLFKQYLSFHGVNIGGFVVYEILLLTMIGFVHMPELWANWTAIFGGFMINYFGSERLVFATNNKL